MSLLGGLHRFIKKGPIGQGVQSGHRHMPKEIAKLGGIGGRIGGIAGLLGAAYLGGTYLAGAGGGGVGLGGTTSASAAPVAAGGSWSPFATQMGYAGGTVGSGAGATTAGSSPAWQDYARMGNSMMQQGQGGGGGQQQPLQHQYVGQQQQQNPYLRGYPWS